MTGTDLIEQDLKTILASQDGNYVEQYEKVVKAIDQTAVEATKTSREMRKERWKKAIAKLDRKDMAKLRKAFTELPKIMRANSAILDVDEPTRLEPQEAHSLMEQWLYQLTVEEGAKASRELIKERVMGAMTAQYAEEGDDYPEQVAASIDVPELNHRFAREGCGRQDPELDEDKLAKLLGAELWAQVSTDRVIPAQIVREVDYAKLMKLARTNPMILEHLKGALKVGQWKKPRFVVRPI